MSGQAFERIVNGRGRGGVEAQATKNAHQRLGAGAVVFDNQYPWPD